jgi:hypothetical protein
MNLQPSVDFWKSKFQVLENWDIKYTNDGENYCKSLYNVGLKRMVIFPCDIDVEDDYIFHEIIKMALIVGNQAPELAAIVVEDICSLIRG